MPALLLCVVLLALAQVPVPSQVPPTFRGRTDLVTLDVTVTEGNGRPVAGLTAADFEIYEDGSLQALSVFRAVDVAVNPWPVSWMGDIRHDVVTNAVPTGRLIAIVVDDAMMRADPAIMNATRSAVRVLIDDLGPDDRCALIFTRDGRGAQPFTPDRERLRASLERLSIGFTGTPGNQLSDSIHAVGSLRTLDDLVLALGSTDHFPRALVYVGSGVDIDWDLVSTPGVIGLKAGGPAIQGVHQTYASRLRAILQRASRSNIVVHTITPGHAVMGPSVFNLTLSRNTGGVAVESAYSMTGGLEEIRRQVSKVADATRTTYLLGYVPAALKPGIRRTEVKVRRPGLTVRTRANYERPTEAARAEAEARRPPPEIDAITGVLPKAGLPLRVAVVPMPMGSSRFAAVAIVLGVRHPSGGHRAVESLTLATGAYDMNGQFKAATKGRAQVQMSGAAATTAEYEVYGRIQLPPGRYQLRLSVDHRARGETGSVYTDVDVPDFTKPGLHVTGLLLDAGPARLKVAPSDLLKEDVPILPTAQRDFPAGTRVLAFARLVQGGRDPLQAVPVTVRLRNESGVIVRTVTSTLTAEHFKRSHAADYQIGLATEGLAPGWYLVTLEAALPGSPIQRSAVSVNITARPPTLE